MPTVQDLDNFWLFGQQCRDDLMKFVSKTTSDLSTAFTQLQIILKQRENISKVSYSPICRFQHPLQIACRGTTWFADGTWFFTIPKFPNGHQSMDFFGTSEDHVIAKLQQQDYTFAFMPKWDGSAIHIFRHQGKTFAYTLGCLNTNVKMQSMIDESPTF
ncbi:MAG TPA: hypothetical protein PLS49_09200, partial [Candidatus Woesebacteria bacterium]|nr:hypothetical protein [Candidatus Woesebacteria bacterium]